MRGKKVVIWNPKGIVPPKTLGLLRVAGELRFKQDGQMAGECAMYYGGRYLHFDSTRYAKPFESSWTQ